MAATAISGQVRRPAIRRPGLGRDDQRLVDLVRAGDDGAFEAIYDRYAPGLLAFCRHLLSSREEAEDAVQHSFGAAYRTLRASDDDIELRPWLYTIARNRCLSLLRARRTDVSLDVDEACGPHADGLADVVQLRSDLRELLEDLRQLPDDQRAALVLLEFGGLPHEEIAAVLDVRQGKTKALVFQAREGLMRARRARDLPCTEMREQLASLSGKVPRRSMLRRHVDRCPSCALFEAEVGRQRAGLALILPVLPTVGLKSIVLGSAIGRGAAVAGGGAGAGGGAAVLGGAGAGGASLTGAGGGSGVAALAGAGAGAGGSAGVASGGGILAGAAAGGVGGSVATATAGGAGTIGAALGAKTASGVLMKVLAVVAVGGGVAGTAESGLTPMGGARTPAVQQIDAGTALPSPVVSALPTGLDPAAGGPAVVAADTPAPPVAHDAPPLTASTATTADPDPTSPVTPIVADPTTPGTLGGLPSTTPTPGPLQPTPASDPATAQAPATIEVPAATTDPATAPTTISTTSTTTTTAAESPTATTAPATTMSTTVDSSTPTAADPATGGTTPPTTTTAAPAGTATTDSTTTPDATPTSTTTDATATDTVASATP